MSCPARDSEPRAVATARQAGQCLPQHGLQSHLGRRWRAEWGWHSPGMAGHTGSNPAGLTSSQPRHKAGQNMPARSSGKDHGWCKCRSRLVGEGDACPCSFSQQSCFQGGQLQGGTSAPGQSRSATRPAQALGRGGSCGRGGCRKTLQDDSRLLRHSGPWWFIHTIFQANKYLFDDVPVYSPIQHFGLNFTPVSVAHNGSKAVVWISHLNVLPGVTFCELTPTRTKLLLTPVEVFFGSPQQQQVLHAEVFHSC